MNFQRGRDREEPEINLIPMIDVLLVIIIFLMVTTTYEKFSALKINLPQASGEQFAAPPVKISVSVDAIEHYAINDTGVVFGSVGKFSQALRRAAGDQKDPMIVINADAKTPHQAVINIMEAARQAGFNSITFTTSRK